MMAVQKLQDVFEQRQQKKPAFIPFIMGGYPDYESSIQIALALQEAGASIIEVGFPYSDPLADGPTIQLAHEGALKAGMTFSKGLQLIREMRSKGVMIPLLIFTSYNPVHQFGIEKFVDSALEAGAQGTLVPDLPHEESVYMRGICQQKGFAFISFVAPTSKQRIEEIVTQADGFVYCVSSLGVTGVRDSISNETLSFLEKVRSLSKIPVAVGFGVSKRDHVQVLAKKVDGIIVGSAIIKIITNHVEQLKSVDHKQVALDALKKFVEELLR
jgi:tryptophan synthase alpha chain